MGQYYKPISLDKKEYVYSHDYHDGLKLMEHSYIGNSFVQAVESLLIPDGDWYKNRIVWAGDYMDDDIFLEEIGYTDKDNHVTLYVAVKTKIKPNKIDSSEYRYIVNHSTLQYVDKNKAINDDGWQIHSLPLLTCSGNGRGGGDYHGDGIDTVGIWAGHSISIEKEVPDNYVELITNFKV